MPLNFTKQNATIYKPLNCNKYSHLLVKITQTQQVSYLLLSNAMHTSGKKKKKPIRFQQQNKKPPKP